MRLIAEVKNRGRKNKDNFSDFLNAEKGIGFVVRGFAKPSSHPERSEGSPFNGYRWTWEILRQALQNDEIEGFATVSLNEFIADHYCPEYFFRIVKSYFEDKAGWCKKIEIPSMCFSPRPDVFFAEDCR